MNSKLTEANPLCSSKSALHVVVLTHSPSPYQVELFDAVAALPGISLAVIYLYSKSPARSWARRAPQHRHWFSDMTDTAEVCAAVDVADLLVVNYYLHPLAAELLPRRAASAKPWVFWGERPGFAHPLLGRLARLWLLRVLHASSAPIWGMGEFALASYRREFGAAHLYVNLPYFSDLARFGLPKKGASNQHERVILFSGALIPRKGVDLLAKAFVVVAQQFPNLRLHLLGSGELETELRRALEPVVSQVTFLGFKDWDELPNVYADADVLCVPSRYDGWGLVVPEGLAAGLPVIASKRMGAALDLIEDGENGWLIEADDEPAIRQALQHAAMLDEAELVKMSESARQAVAEHSLAHGAGRFLAACVQAIRA